MRRPTDGGQRILDALDEALAWARGEDAATMIVIVPGEPARKMTIDEYREHGAARATRIEVDGG